MRSVQHPRIFSDDQWVLTSSDTLPYVDPLLFGIPDAALCVHRPVEVDFPDAGHVVDKTGHRVLVGAAARQGEKR